MSMIKDEYFEVQEEEYMPSFEEPQMLRNAEFVGESDGDEARLKRLLYNFDMDFLYLFLKASDITYRSLRYLSVDDINTAIRSIGYRAEFREKLFAWRRKKYRTTDKTIEPPPEQHEDEEPLAEPLIPARNNVRKRRNSAMTPEEPESDFEQNSHSNAPLTNKARKRPSSAAMPDETQSDLDQSLLNNVSKSSTRKGELTPISIRSQLNVPDVIQQSESGRRVKEFYAKNGYLELKHRTDIIALIVDFLISNGIKMHCSDFDTVTDEIIKVFPSEKDSKQFYFIPRKPMGYPMGRMYTRYYCAIRKSRRKQSHDDCSNASDISNKEAASEQPEKAPAPALDEFALSAIKTFLSCDGIDFEDVRNMWSKAFSMRVENSRHLNTQEFLQQWPKFLLPRGAELFSIDFNLKFPHKSAQLFLKWSHFKAKMYNFYDTHIKDDVCKSIYAMCKYKQDDLVEQYVLLALLSGVLPPTAGFKDGLGTNRRRPSIADAINWFATFTPALDQIQEKTQELLQKYSYYNSEQPLPDIVIVGERPVNIREIYVRFAGVFYAVPNFLCAVDVCMHIYRVLALPYPKPIEYPWGLIQRYFYDISLPEDANCPALISLLAYLRI